MYDLGFFLGKHCEKKKTFFDTLNGISYPIQIFTGSPKSWKRNNPNEEDIEKTKKIITEKNIILFIHSLYFINLAKDNLKQIENLNWELSTGLSLGSKGIVVHVGKHLNTIKHPLDVMYNNIMKLNISPKCPLILETPAGQGTECLVDIEEFIKFVKRFDNRLKVCIDTCHVWASGYNPMEYIEKFINEAPNKLVLVHFNDSKNEKGSKKDRHEIPTKGFIGKEIMDKVFQYCTKMKIPMIIE